MLYTYIVISALEICKQCRLMSLSNVCTLDITRDEPIKILLFQ